MAGTVSSDLKKILEQKALCEVQIKKSNDQIECLKVTNSDVKLNKLNSLVDIQV